jgi:ATP-dependent helicase/nuclease subunit B
MSTPPQANHVGVTTIRVAPPIFLDTVAEHLVDQLAERRGQAIDLSHVVVLVPLRAAQALRGALINAYTARGHAAMLLPQITTLDEWISRAASAANVRRRIVSRSERVLDVFELLKKQRWFSSADSLAVSAELVRLADELSQNMAQLPTTLAEHEAALQRAYAIGKRNADFSFEAKLTYEIWKNLAEPTPTSLDAAAAHAMRLAETLRVAREHPHAAAPLVVIGASRFNAREQRFFAAYGEIARVTLCDETWAEVSDTSTPWTRFLTSAWADAPGASHARPPGAGRCENLRCYAAPDVESEAREALNTLRQWLAAGKRDIAIVALDRLAARRLRALAEREQILMRDEIGWPYSTTLSATAVMRWLEAKRDGFYYKTLIDLLKSPFVFRDVVPNTRVKAAVLQIEHVILRDGILSGLLAVRDALTRTNTRTPARAHTALPAAEDVLSDARLLIDRVIEADRTFTPQRRSAPEWLRALVQSLDTLGIGAGLANDEAGAGLLTLFATLQDEVATCTNKMPMTDWIDWLRLELEHARFRDQSIESPVVMTSLEATRFRRFDAVLLLGASDANLPGKAEAQAVFNQSVRATLKLRSRQDTLADITADLAGLMLRSDAQWISWQTGMASRDQPQGPSPWVAAMLLEAKRGGFRIEENLKLAIPQASSGALAATPSPILDFSHVPSRISVSAAQSLVDCPYRFFSRGVLKLGETEDVSEEMLKREFGLLVHDILNRFHARFPQLAAHDRGVLLSALEVESASVFAPRVAADFSVRAWQLRWQKAMAGYLDWHLEREADGWRWHAGEAKERLLLALGEGHELTVEGRLDRVELRDDAKEEVAVIDYKLRDASGLNKKLNDQGDDVQLALYAALAHATFPAREVTEAAYLSIEGEKVTAIEQPHPADAGAQQVARLTNVFRALRAGAPMPAHGVESVCKRCEARGLCRRDHWLDADVDINDGATEPAT